MSVYNSNLITTMIKAVMLSLASYAVAVNRPAKYLYWHGYTAENNPNEPMLPCPNQDIAGITAHNDGTIEVDPGSLDTSKFWHDGKRCLIMLNLLPANAAESIQSFELYSCVNRGNKLETITLTFSSSTVTFYYPNCDGSDGDS